MSEQLLKGIRVLDFTDFLAGPYCSMYLADMGAEVIKIENIKGGNFTRTARPKEKATGRSMYFQNLNRNKKGVALDLKTEEGKSLFAKLVASSDVLLENMRPGVLSKLGFSYEACKELNKGIIYASISGFGQTGTNSRKPGYDLIAQAMGGAMSITGEEGAKPLRAGLAVGDMFAGLNACTAICASLYKRNETGMGQQIDIALVDSIVSAMEKNLMSYVHEGEIAKPTGSRYVTSAPYDIFKAKDDYFVIASGTDAHFVKFAQAIGKPELANDTKFIDTPSRNANNPELKSIIEDWASNLTARECVAAIDSVGVPAALIYNTKQLCEDDTIVKEREMLVTVKHPEAGELTVIGSPMKMSAYPVQYNKAAPDLGEDNDDIFTALGVSADELQALKDKGVI